MSATALKSKATKGKGKEKAPKPSPSKAAVVAVAADDDAHDESSDSEDEGVDEQGMKRLLAALGEDGLDDFDQAQLAALDGDEDEDEDSEDENDAQKSGASESGSDDAMAQDLDESDTDEEEDDDDVALDEIPSGDEDVDMDMDIVPTQKITVDDKAALDRIHALIKLDPAMPWTETLTVTYPEPLNVDVDNDLERELAFYKQALHGAQTARKLAQQHNFPWTRPADYFAEMVKSDAHMERVRQKLLDEGAGIKRSEEKRREREGKKFGKQVQQEKLRERAQARKDMDEKIKGLKRKRKGALEDGDGGDGEDFDVALDDDRPSKRPKGADGRSGGGLPRHKRDQKFGFGAGGNRRSKQNTRDSTDDFGGGGGGGRGGARGGARGGRGGFKVGGRGGGSGGGRGGGAGGRGGGAGGRGGAKRMGKSRRVSDKSKK